MIIFHITGGIGVVDLTKNTDTNEKLNLVERIKNMESDLRSLHDGEGFIDAMRTGGEPKWLFEGYNLRTAEQKAAVFIKMVQRFVIKPANAEIYLALIGLLKGYSNTVGDIGPSDHKIRYERYMELGVSTKRSKDFLRKREDRAISELASGIMKYRDQIPSLLFDLPEHPENLVLPEPKYYLLHEKLIEHSEPPVAEKGINLLKNSGESVNNQVLRDLAQIAIREQDFDTLNSCLTKMSNHFYITQLLVNLARDRNFAIKKDYMELFHKAFSEMDNNKYRHKVFEGCLKSGYFKEHPDQLLEPHMSEYTNNHYIYETLVVLYELGLVNLVEQYSGLLKNASYIKRLYAYMAGQQA